MPIRSLTYASVSTPFWSPTAVRLSFREMLMAANPSSMLHLR
jgi:hypothetical protein